MEGRNEDEETSHNSDKKEDNIFTRLFKAVTGQLEQSEKKSASIVEEAAEAALHGKNLATRSVLSSLSRLNAYFSRKSFSIDADLKQFWKPDDSTRACWNCKETFTAIRRRHHCGICGEIFCSKCCDRIIHGRFFGFGGEMRSCEFCCKVLIMGIDTSRLTCSRSLSLQNLKRILKLTDFDSSQFEREFSNQTLDTSVQASNQSKAYGFLEENYVVQDSRDEALSTDAEYQAKLLFEKQLMYREKEALQDLRNLMVYGPSPLPLSTNWHHLRSVSNCFTGKHLVDWLIDTEISYKRDYAHTIAQVLLETGYIVGASYIDRIFTADYAIYVICPLDNVVEPNRPLPRELPNWTMEAKDYSSQVTDEYRREMHFESDDETDSDSEEVNVVQKCLRREPVKEENDVRNPNIAVMCPSYHLNRSPEKNYQNLLHRSDTQESEYSQDDSSSTISELKISALDDMPKDQILSETQEESIKFREAARTLWEAYEKRLLLQLIEYSGISEEWIDVIRNLSHVVSKSVTLDVRKSEDQLDIRKFVKFKKVLVEGDRQAEVINGVICTKNILLLGMKTRFVKPQILLIEKSIHFPNSGEKYLNLETIMEQEPPYLKMVSDKIIALRPNIVVIGHHIAYRALAQLMEAGITVIASVKESVMERIARTTEAQIVKSLDTQLTHAVLGTCRSFYLKTYVDCAYGKNKVLMFFDICPANLDCTVILKGQNYDELYHVKRISYLMLLAVHNFTRETAFLREISASLLPILPQASISKNDKCTQSPVTESPTRATKSDEVTFSELTSQISCITDISDAVSPEPTETRPVSDFSDPLQSFLECGERVPAKPVNEYDFASALSKVVLSISPYYSFSVPYLESAAGKKSLLTKYFTPKPYSSHLLEATMPKKVSVKPPPLPGSHIKIISKPPHPLLSTNITKSVDDNDISALIADFRARGGPVELEYDDSKLEELLAIKPPEKKSDYRSPIFTKDRQVDALHPFNHQSISLLYCSFSEVFEETSKFCVHPCFIQIDFFGRNDISLGKYLEQYCFSDSYQCPSSNCYVPPNNHVRKFSHASACIDILIRNSDSIPSFKDDDLIYLWSWCKTCKKHPQYDRQPISDEVYNLSFAKYLELRFYQDKISRRGGRKCCHSIHQENFHYFKKRKTAVIIRYQPVDLRELVIPPTKLAYTIYPVKYSYLTEQFKNLTEQGGSIFMSGFEQQQKLADVAGANLEPKIKSLVADQVQHRLLYKEKQNSIQIHFSDNEFLKRLEENKCTEGDLKKLYQILDEIIDCKSLLMKVVSDWNAKIQDFLQIKKREEKIKPSVILTRPISVESNTAVPSDESSTVEGNRTTDHIFERHLSCVEGQVTETQSYAAIPDYNLGDLTEEAGAFYKEQKLIMTWANELQLPTKRDFVEGFTRVLSPPASSVLKLLQSSSPAEYFATSCSEKDVSGGLDKAFVVYPSMNESRLSSTLSDIAQSSAEVAAYAASAATRQPTDAFGLMEPPELPAEAVDSPDRKSGVKQLISSFWNSPLESLIKCPFSSWEHYGALPHAKVPIAIIEQEPSSFIAHCLASKKYEIELNILQRKMRNSKISLDPCENTGVEGGVVPLPIMGETVTPHIELQFKDQSTDFYIKIIFAEHFRNLRKTVFPYGEDIFIRSLARCIPWEAKGGKSGSAFCKTTDDRFVLKGLSKSEALSFMQFGPHYIQYIIQCQKESQPTVLAKILGVYYIVYKNNATGKASKITLLVMENLFYRRKISHKFDLKGCVRNRMVSISTNPEAEIVLMDQNLVKMSCSSPLFLREHSKEVLTRAVHSDTDFLCKQAVIDYSLLVGVDEEQNELVVGVIDFIRGYTFDKKIESLIKQSINPKQTPTVVPPETYRARFCKAMNQYFLCMPDRWFQFGTKIQSGSF